MLSLAVRNAYVVALFESASKLDLSDHVPVDAEIDG